MKTIDTEAKINILMSTNLDKIRELYRETDIINDITVLYPSGTIFPYEYNLFTLLANSKEVKFRIEWNQRPAYVSYEYYRTEVYWPLILYINRINSEEEFANLETILIPSIIDILEITKYKIDTIEDVNIKKDKIKYDYTINRLNQNEIDIIRQKQLI